MSDMTGFPMNYFFNFHWKDIFRKGFRQAVWRGILAKLFGVITYVGDKESKMFYSIGADRPLEEIEQQGYVGKHYFWIFGKKIHIYEEKEINF